MKREFNLRYRLVMMRVYHPMQVVEVQFFHDVTDYFFDVRNWPAAILQIHQVYEGYARSGIGPVYAMGIAPVREFFRMYKIVVRKRGPGCLQGAPHIFAVYQPDLRVIVMAA